jgi:hypothetical protein
LEKIPEAASQVSAKAVELPLTSNQEAKPGDFSVFIVDEERGLLATRPLQEVLKTRKWSPVDADYTFLVTLSVMVTSPEGPLATGVVTIQPATPNERKVILSPTMQGKANFEIVPLGDTKVRVEYTTTDAETKTAPTQTFNLTAEQRTVTLTINDKVEVATPPAQAQPSSEPKAEGAAAKTEGGESASKKQPEPPNPLASLLQFACVLVVLGAIGFFVWWYIKNNQKQVQEALKQVGVQGGAGPSGANGPDPVLTQAAPAPLQTIVLPDAAPTPAAPAAAPAPLTPQLRGESGDVFTLQEGATTIGREGADLTLAGESSVSRSHATLTRSGTVVTLADSGSTNGTFVNGQKITSPVTLNPGDTVQFGAVRFRYEG